jgi:hypothetical protein
MLAEERTRLHRLPEHPYATAFGLARRVGVDQPMVQLDWCQYSAPWQLAGEAVWARVHGRQVILTHLGTRGPVEVARHELTTPGNPRVNPDHFPPAPETPLHRTPVAARDAEAEFLAIGAGAALWLTEAGANGVSRVRAKMADAVALAKLAGVETADWALGHAAVHGRFAEADLGLIVAHRADAGETRQAGETHSLQPGTSAWEGFGR